MSPPIDNSRHPGARGSLVIMAVIVLVGVALLGAALGWMQIRGSDIAWELTRAPPLSERPLGRLMDGGLHEVRTAQDLAFGAVCERPADVVRTVPGWGDVQIAFLAQQDDRYRLDVVVRRGSESQTLSCQLICSPGVACPVGKTPQECAGGGGGGGSLVEITACSLQ